MKEDITPKSWYLLAERLVVVAESFAQSYALTAQSRRTEVIERAKYDETFAQARRDEVESHVEADEARIEMMNALQRIIPDFLSRIAKGYPS